VASQSRTALMKSEKSQGARTSRAVGVERQVSVQQDVAERVDERPARGRLDVG
jgi:hypothetical protein